VLPVLEQAIKEQGEGQAVNRPRQIVKSTPNTYMAVLPAGIPSLKSMGFKVYTVAPVGVRWWLLLFDDDGELRSIMESEHLSLLRTGAASGIATKYMSRPDSKVVGIIGTGYQAPAQLDAICAVRTIEKIVAWSPTRENLLKFCHEQSILRAIEVEPANSAQSVASAADILVTITSSADPVLLGDWLKAGSHVNVAGAVRPHKREVDSRALQRAQHLVVDDWQQSHDEAGEFIVAAKEGAINWSKVKELGTVVAGTQPGRTAASDITLFKSHGVGLWDVAAAATAYEAARAKGIGVALPITQTVKRMPGTKPKQKN
jgi:ornithine cyclodeaminase/alanine dehydrogenase-like protein (mu-crystallin family)